MGEDMRARFWVEAVLGAASAVMFSITLVWQDWIEIIFHVDPDRGNGSLEWAIVLALAAVAICAGLLARAEYRRTKPVMNDGA